MKSIKQSVALLIVLTGLALLTFPLAAKETHDEYRYLPFVGSDGQRWRPTLPAPTLTATMRPAPTAKATPVE